MLIWSVLCRSSSTDTESNNVSLFNVVEQLGVPAAADGNVVPIDFELVSLFQRDDPTEPQIEDAELTIRDPSGTVIGTFNLVADMNNTLRSRVRLTSRAFRVSGEGIYWFEMTVNGESAAKVPLSIVFSDTAEVQLEEE